MKRTTAIIILLSLLAIAWFPVPKSSNTSEALLASGKDLHTLAIPIIGSKSICTSETILKGIKFKTITSTIKSDISATIDVIIDNGEREREFQIRCTIWPDSLVLQGVFPAWYYNYSKTYTATIPIK